MSRLIQLRQHINSIKKTRKITYAMRLISMSLYSKLNRKNAPLSYYQQTIAQLFAHLAPHAHEWDNQVLFPKDVLNTTPLIVVVASSKGLCGGFNANLVRYLKRWFFLEDHQQPSFITVGAKARSICTKLELGPLLDSYDTFQSSTFMTITDSIIRHIQDARTPFSSVIFYSNMFKNFFLQKPHKLQLIPFDVQKYQEINNDDDERRPDPFATQANEVLWEQQQSTIVDFLAERYLRSSIMDILFQSLLAEQAARFLAMEQATTNADRFIDKLTIEYNKSRQALITRELAELTSNFSSL